MGMHARFAPSSAHRIFDCPASLLLNEQEPDIERFEAAEGTVAHHVAEICASQDRDAEDFLGRVIDSELLDDYDDEITSSKGFDITVDAEMVAGVNEYLDSIRRLPGDHFVEQRVDISPWCPIPNQFGTCDHAAAQHRKLVITDLKYGKVRVDAERNKQLVMYALGFINEWDWFYDFDEVVIRISQPRLENYDVWVTTKSELLAIGEQIKQRFAMAVEPNPPFGPSEKACRFCRVLYKCKANHDFLYQDRVMMLDDFDCFVEPSIQTFDAAEIAALWLRKPMYESRMRAVEDKLHQMIEDDQFVPGLKLVAGKKSRYFKDQKAVEDFLLEQGLDKDDIWTDPKFVSPHQAEKKLSSAAKKALQDFIESKPGSPCLVSSDDKRQDLVVQRLDMLDDAE